MSQHLPDEGRVPGVQGVEMGEKRKDDSWDTGEEGGDCGGWRTHRACLRGGNGQGHHPGPSELCFLLPHALGQPPPPEQLATQASICALYRK